MATGLGFYALAGGLAGAGKGLVEEARQDFEMMQDELRAKRAAAEAQKGRDFQGEQGRLTREQQVELQNDRLTFDEGQNDLNRRQQEKVAGITAGAAKDRAKEDAARYSDTFTGGDGYLDKLCMELVGLPSSRNRPPTRDVREKFREQARQMLF